ncbi:M24 family metallopeptidase [Anaerosphaera multitolerans]|uniref:Aminopeptidase P family protein n=1 Tax=Anaerosphaera multitolerans TaxID=2487351 RepID=A0A437S792_9FIRM|nr:Xaa-Pro peptidase family protein [Anaerosphaera multitolerans]RVU54808.1 aminopeptidase P family protein [Anaerosphaera multitolerans]
MERIKKVIGKMREENVEQFLICDAYSIFYLTGIKIDAGERLYVLSVKSSGKIQLFINKLFPIGQVEGIDYVWLDDTDDQVGILARNVVDSGIVGIDKKMVAKFLIPLMKMKTGVEFIDGSYLVDDFRSRKDSEEIEKMKAASSLNDRAMEKMKEKLSDDLSEKEMRDYLKEVYSSLESYEFSFDPIVGYGDNAADPHHAIDNSRKKTGDSIVVDIGCILDDYCSDMTRTFFYREVSEEARKIYETVLEANLAGIAAVKPGARFCDVDRAAREVIEKAGYGEYFTHRTGHSIGMETHEIGDVSSINEDLLKPGNIFSIEPGIYIPGVAGVRIEDLVLVTEDGCEVLNDYPKNLTIIK